MISQWKPVKRGRLAMCAMTIAAAVSVAGAVEPNDDVTAPFVPISEQERKAVVAAAPKPLRVAGDLELELVDFIDCAGYNTTHLFADDGFSRVRTTPMGTYRETAVSDNSFFAYRLFVKNIHAPHLIVAEYPDDKERTVSIFLHEEGMRGTYNSDFHIEGGYYTGGIYPVSDEFCTFQSIFWPATQGPAIVCLNEHHGSPAAMSRIWLYEIKGPMTPAPVNEPAGPTRQIGIFFEDSRMFRFNFGRGGGGIEHCMEYLNYTGQNLLSFDSVIYGYAKSKIPSFDGGNDDTENVLAAADRHGIDFLAVFDPTQNFKVDGKPTGDLTDDAVIDAWAKALEEFVGVYGKHPSLKGISFGGPAGCNRMASPKFGKLQNDIYAMLQRKRPDLVQHVFFGYKYLHRFIFNERDFTADKIVRAWERDAKGASFSQVLAAKVADYYRSIHLNIEDFRGKPNMMVHRSYYPNDERCFRFYPLRTPRYMIFRDFNASQAVTDLVQTGEPMGACLFGNYFEATTPLFEGLSFWWDRTWIAPQINPAEPFFMECYTLPLSQQDFPVLLNASWVNPTIGAPHLIRPFARAFRSLPAKTFDTAAGENFVVARQLAGPDTTYLYLLNNHHTPAQVAVTLTGEPAGVINLVDGKQVAEGDTLELILPAYGLHAFSTAGGRTIAKMAVVRDKEAHEPLRLRIADFGKNIRLLNSDPESGLSPNYKAMFETVGTLFNQQKYQQAAEQLGYSPERELALWIAVAKKKPVFAVRRTTGAVIADGDLTEWPDAASIALNTPEQLVCDRWLFNNWAGEPDLSAEVMAAYDDENLYLAFKVRDDVYREGDVIRFGFDQDNFRSRAEGFRYAKVITIGAPEAGAGGRKPVMRTDDGYQGEVVIPLADLKLTGAGSLTGFHVDIVDMDMGPADWKRLTRGKHPWRREKRMEWPVNPDFNGSRDPQSAGVMVLE